MFAKKKLNLVEEYKVWNEKSQIGVDTIRTTYLVEKSMENLL